MDRVVSALRNVPSTLLIGTLDELGTPIEREDDVCLAGIGGRSRVVKGAGSGRNQGDWLRGLAALSVLDTALNAIDAPVFIIDLGGEVLHANTNAQTLLERDRGGVSRALVQAVAGAPAERAWDLTPLHGAERAQGFLAIMRPPRHQIVVHDPLRTASQRWQLTARQTEVLRWLAHGLTNSLIAQTLGISERTVEFHLKAIFDKAGVDNRATLIVKLLES